MRLQVAQDQVRHGLARLVRPAPHVGHQHDVVEREQRLGHVGLVLKHVEARPAEAPLDERGDQLGLVDVRAAPDVDEQALGPQRLNHLAVDDVPGLLVQRAGHHEDVAVCGQFYHARVIGVAGAVFLCSLVVVDWAIEGLHSGGNGKPYPAQPDDAYSFATELQKG
ncbi:uncharacterized protein [Triticum aestivum]|uniref:uncharacterized protein n=1 Tax=Triticum aestivum TaxID=4565 RepID=UPI001D02E309|nr:uncharacterized protein LOC123076193 [Triticum aestivum]